MSYDESKKFERRSGSRSNPEHILNPNWQEKMKKEFEQSQRKEFLSLKSQMELKKLQQKQEKQAKVNTPKELSGDTKPVAKQFLAEARRQERANKTKGQTEESRKSP